MGLGKNKIAKIISKKNKQNLKKPPKAAGCTIIAVLS